MGEGRWGWCRNGYTINLWIYNNAVTTNVFPLRNYILSPWISVMKAFYFQSLSLVVHRAWIIIGTCYVTHVPHEVHFQHKSKFRVPVPSPLGPTKNMLSVLPFWEKISKEEALFFFFKMAARHIFKDVRPSGRAIFHDGRQLSLVNDNNNNNNPFFYIALNTPIQRCA